MSARERRTEAGGSLLEALITVSIVAVVLYVLVSSVGVMSSSSEFGHKHLDLVADADRVLDTMVSELQQTSTTELDPLTNEPYITVEGDAGARVVRFRRLVGIADNGAEVLGVWSTPIEFRLEGGLLIRSQDGAEDVVADSIQRLDIALDDAGRLEVEIQVDAAQLRAAADTVVRSRLVQTL